MIIRENILRVDDVSNDLMINHEGMEFLPEDMIFFDLEHYVYKKPKCIGVFGACVYNSRTKSLEVTQYMIENRYEGLDILYLAKNYFISMKNKGKKAIVTFSGNNDFTVINYLFQKYGVIYNFNEEFASVDIQKEYERESEVISGSNLAKTFHKVMKDKDYIKRMPREKIEKILLYNEQDVVNLYHIFVNWKSIIFEDKEEDEVSQIKSIEDIEIIDEEILDEVAKESEEDEEQLEDIVIEKEEIAK